MDEGGAATVDREAPAPTGWWSPRPATPAQRRRRGDAVFGAVMVLLWVAWLVITAMSQTRLVTPDRFTSDLDAGRVVSWRVVAVQPEDSRWSWAGDLRLNLPASLPNGDVDPEQERVPGGYALGYVVDGFLARTRVVDPALSAAPETSAQQARQAGVRPADEDPGAWLRTTMSGESALWASAPLVLLFLAAVLVGPRPTRGTRWFWFWQAWVTLGLGVLAYAVAEQLRPAAAPGSPGAPRRARGWAGFLVAVGASLVVGTLVGGLGDTSHWLWVVRP